MTVERIGPDGIDAVVPLGQAYAFKPYRNYRVFPRAAQDAALEAELRNAVQHPDASVHAARSAAGTAAAAIVVRRLPWDSAYFGVPMAQLDHVLGDDRVAREAVLRGCLAELRDEGVRHVAARVDVADLASVHLLEDHGFRVMESLVTYVSRPGREPAVAVRPLGCIRPLRDGDARELVAIADEAFRGFQGRFHADPHLPNDRADALYAEWAAQCFAGRMADTVLVSEGADGRLLGFLAFRRREPASTALGREVFGGGLGACRRDTPGAFAGLVRAGTEWAHARGGVAECQTQNHNFAAIRIYEAVGARYVGASYTLHAWLGDGAAPAMTPTTTPA